MKILFVLFIMLTLSFQAFADQPTTVLHESLHGGTLTGERPVLDGATNAELQKAANRTLKKLVDELADRMDKRGRLDFEVALNRPSLVTMTLHGHSDGGKDFYKAANIDLTTGREFTLDDFFQATESRTEIMGDAETSDVLFAEDGVYTHSSEQLAYLTRIPYSDLLSCCRIGDIGRILPVWRLTRECEERTLQVPEGSLIAIRVESNPSTGYRWQPVVTGGTGNLYLIGGTFTMTNENPDSVGASGYEILVMAAQTSGVYDVKMQYKRPWEKFGAAQEFIFHVDVK